MKINLEREKRRKQATELGYDMYEINKETVVCFKVLEREKISLDSQDEKLPHGDLLALEESARERGLLDTEGRLEVTRGPFHEPSTKN
jgi:hypothetical protein